MTAKQLKEQDADEAIERRRREFNDDGFAQPKLVIHRNPEAKPVVTRWPEAKPIVSPHGDPLLEAFNDHA